MFLSWTYYLLCPQICYDLVFLVIICSLHILLWIFVGRENNMCVIYLLLINTNDSVFISPVAFPPSHRKRRCIFWASSHRLRRSNSAHSLAMQLLCGTQVTLMQSSTFLPYFCHPKSSLQSMFFLFFKQMVQTNQ